MLKNDHSVDYQLIWKKIEGIISEEEEIKLQQWADQHPDRQEYLDRCLRTQSIPDDPIVVDAEKSWQALQADIAQAPPKKRIAYRTSIAASLLLLIVGFGGYWVINRWLLDEKKVVVTTTPVPGNTKAVLVTEEGESFELTDTRLLDKIASVGARAQSSGLYYSPTPNAPGLVPKVAYHTLIVPRGGEYFVSLADGSKVWLNAESTLRYPTSFQTLETRQLYLEGEAYFEVSKSEVPFVVTSAGQSVKVLGTAFNISSHNKGAVSTTLVHGSVEVFPTNDPKQSQLLTPNHQSLFDRTDGTITQQAVDVDEFVAWKDGFFQFNNTPLDEIMNVLTRWYDVEVHISDEAIKQIPFTAKIKRQDDLKDILELIRETSEISYQLTDNQLWIKPRNNEQKK